MLSVSSSNLSDAAVRSTGCLRKSMGTQIPQRSFLIPLTPLSLPSLKCSRRRSYFSQCDRPKDCFQGSFPKLVKLLKPEWGFCKNILLLGWRLSSLWTLRCGWYFQEEQDPHKVHVRLPSTKILDWTSVLHIQNTLLLYLFVFQNHGGFDSLGSVITTGPQAGGQMYLVGICLHHSAQGILRFATSQSGWDALILEATSLPGGVLVPEL